MVEYKNVRDLPIIEEATENTHVIVEDSGSFKRMSGDKLGGGGVKTAIIKSIYWDEGIEYFASGGPQEANTEESEYVCENMTFTEAYDTLASGQPLTALFCDVESGPALLPCIVRFLGISLDGVHKALMLMFLVPGVSEYLSFYWTEEYGITWSNPFEPEPS